MKTKTDRAMETQRAFTDRVASIYRDAVHFKLSHQAILDKVSALVWTQGAFKALPRYRRESIRAVYYHLFSGPADLSIYRHLEYRMLYKGKYYGNGFDAWRALFPNADASEIENGEHFWIGTDNRF